MGVRPLARILRRGALAGVILAAGCSKTESGPNLRSPEVVAADRMWSRGDNDNARNALEAAAENPSLRFAAIYRLGILWMDEDPHLALEYFTEAAKLAPEHPGPVFFSGIVQNFLNAFTEADRDMRKGFEMARHRLGYALPETTAAAGEGLSAMGQGQYPAAAAAFERALTDNPDVSGLWVLRAMALAETRALEPAREAVEHALQLQPDLLEARVLRARLLAMAGNPEAARTELEAVLEKSPSLASAHFEMGQLQLRDSDFRDALLSFWWSLLDDPTQPAAHSFVAETFSRMQQSIDAMPSYRRVETINAFLGRYYGRRGFLPRR